MSEFSADSIRHFWAKVNVAEPSHCWEWNGARTPKGYGNVTINGESWKSHRAAWTIAHFPIPDGYSVCHACDNPSCCNPGHLLLGSARANFTDMVTKERAEFRKNKAVGTRNVNAKLTDPDVAEIRSLYASGSLNQYQLAEKFGVSQPAIGSIVRNETWRHVQTIKTIEEAI